MSEKQETEETVNTLGCAAIAAFFVAALIGCIALGLAFGAEWGVAGVAVVVSAFGVLMILAAKSAKRKMENDGDGR